MADPKKYGYERLEVYQLSHELANRIDELTLRLPASSRFEEGEQARRSSKSVSSLIVEGYGLRKNRDQWLHFLHQALASSDETREHLRYLYEGGSLKDHAAYSALAAACEKLSAKLGRFIIGVGRHHSKPFYLR